MKALSLWQPWASLVALGVKTIETRSWSTSYRGPLAIHAGARWPEMMNLPSIEHTRDPARRAEVDEHNGSTWLVLNTIVDPAFQGPQPQGKRIPKRALAPTLFWPHRGPHARLVGEPDHLGHRHAHTEHLPLGAVVATCTLVDVVPIDASVLWNGTPERLDGTPPPPENYGWLEAGPAWRWIFVADEADRPNLIINEGERPFGDYTPGRYAWLLDDITPLAEPVPTRGRQGVWEWTP